MNATILELLISKLGQPFSSALAGIDTSGLVRADSSLDPDIYYFTDEDGPELVFVEGTDEFCELNISFEQFIPDEPTYSGQLPFPLKAGTTREGVAAVLGKPKASGGPRSIAGLGESGGWDKFDLSAFPGVLCITGYNPNGGLRHIRFVTKKHL